ncbi:MAG: GHKL domain-containing protein, partial [Helicobacter sp.]|nr:GHKL domain-containing protein [Helicobacter sp.]
LNKSFVYPEFDTFLHKINTQNRVIRSAIKRIRQKQQEFNTLISNMNDGLLLLKPSGEIITFNSSANTLIGKLDEVSNITEIESSDVSAAFLANCENTHWLDKHIQIGNKNIEIIQSPIYIKKKLHGTLILMHDVTQKVEFEELKKEFMANITHDLKTPITSIMVTSEMLHNGLIGADDSGRFVQSIFAESKRMLEMVNRILEISRFDEQNLTEYPKKLIDLHAIAARVSVRMDTIAQKKSISVSFAGESAQILGVEEMIENMLENLCDNAIKYSKENTAIHISLFHENNHIVLQVQDEGIGISKDDQQRVFERFFCVDKSRNKAINGIGLGLSIVKNIAHYHGATLTLESELDVGTCFTIRFPKQKML